MNYVGQLAGQVFVQVKELYRGLNPATLSGCIDVIVVRQPDGSLQCSPFHVRFGKMGVLRSREKVVDIEINGEPVSLHMKLGENGEAFFVKETENKMEVVPSYLATSPIMSTGQELMKSHLARGNSRHHDSIPCGPLPVQNLGLQQSEGGLTKKRRKRKKKARPEGGGGGAGLRREESGEEFSDDEDMFTIDLSSDEEMEGDSSRCVCARESLNMFACMKQRGRKKERLLYLPAWYLTGEKKHLLVVTVLFAKPMNHLPDNPKQMFDFNFSSSPDDSQSSTPKSDSELTNPSKDNPEMLWTWGELPQAAQKQDSAAVVSIPVSSSTHFRAISDMGTLCSPVPPLDKDTEENRNGHIVREQEKRSQHLGADGIYLDDITELEPEVAALYFPKTDGGSSSMKGDTEMMVGVRSANQSPQSVGSSGVDSGVDSLVDQVCDLPHVAISLCGGLTDNREITKEQFMEKAVSYQQFSENPSIIDDPNLVVKIGSKYYNWNTAAPVMLAMQVYQKPLPQASVENIMKDKMPKKGGRWWFSWRSRNNDYKSVSAQIDMQMMNLLKDESSSSDEDHKSSSQISGVFQSEPLESSGGICYKKTLRLTSEQLASLQLREGPNEVVFSVTTQYQGTCRCHGTIYLWSWDDKIVISDIDGTITRSDTLGHILPTLGKDWTHQGIARLYHRVSLNGYKFMYCSARAIGMADMTRGYLHWVNERGTMLPMGPVLLSPSSLFSALHREVIEKKPEKFKIECLTDIKHLFYPNTEPFYAAFGNRATDVYSYKEVGVPLNRIFTVNPKGELVQEHAKTNISSYGRLCDMVDHVFPVFMQGEEADFPHSDDFDQCNYWNKVLPEDGSLTHR
uniref:phosphatidate phosphatase n=1 Tax=Astatotilapia calliptera TaxID=8154 RepID=A0AAX7VQQ8_ASTCA